MQEENNILKKIKIAVFIKYDVTTGKHWGEKHYFIEDRLQLAVDDVSALTTISPIQSECLNSILSSKNGHWEEYYGCDLMDYISDEGYSQEKTNYLVSRLGENFIACQSPEEAETFTKIYGVNGNGINEIGKGYENGLRKWLDKVSIGFINEQLVDELFELQMNYLCDIKKSIEQHYYSDTKIKVMLININYVTNLLYGFKKKHLEILKSFYTSFSNSLSYYKQYGYMNDFISTSYTNRGSLSLDCYRNLFSEKDGMFKIIEVYPLDISKLLLDKNLETLLINRGLKRTSL